MYVVKKDKKERYMLQAILFGRSVGLFLTAGVLLALFALSSTSALAFSATSYINDELIDVNDGTLDDWPVESNVIDEEGVSDVDYNTWCFTEGAWDDSINSIGECGDGLFYNGDASMDIQKGYFGISATNLLMGIEAGFPMMAVWDGAANAYVDFQTLAFDSVNYGDITTLPEAYDHKMVFAFGPADEDVFDYYMVASINFPQDLSSISGGGGEELGAEAEGSDETGINVFAESGDTVGWQEDEDTVIAALDPEDSETSGEGGENLSSLFEVKLNAVKLFEVTGMVPTESYGFRLETHSVTDVSDRVVVDFSVAEILAAPTGLKIKNRAVRGATAAWNTVAGAASYNIELVDGEDTLIKAFSGKKAKTRPFKKKWLVANKPNKFRVQAVSANDVEGTWSDYKTFRTLPKRFKPSDITVTMQNELIVGLQLVEYRVKKRGKVKNYIFKTYDSDGALVDKTVTPFNNFLEGLEPGDYTVKVRQAFNKKNKSKWSEMKSFTVTE